MKLRSFYYPKMQTSCLMSFSINLFSDSLAMLGEFTKYSSVRIQFGVKSVVLQLSHGAVRKI